MRFVLGRNIRCSKTFICTANQSLTGPLPRGLKRALTRRLVSLTSKTGSESGGQRASRASEEALCPGQQQNIHLFASSFVAPLSPLL